MTQYANLFEAIHNDDLKYFSSLLECITWPRTTDYLDVKLLNAALEFGRKDIVNHLLDQKCRLTEPESNVHALHLALAQPDFYDIVKRLLALGASVSERNSDGDNAIHIAFLNGVAKRTIDILLLRYLSETGENAKNADGLSVLHIVCTRPNLFIMKKFVEKLSNDEKFQDELNCQVDLNCNSIYAGYTPLHFTVSYSRKEITRYLVMNFNVDAFIQDVNYSTPLHLALERRDIHAIDLIMAYNFPKVAHKDFVNFYGLSHFMASCASNIQDFAVKFMEVAEVCSTESLKVLVNRQVNIINDNNKPPFAGYSPMHFAAEFGRSNTVQQLAHYGASLFIKTVEDFSPLVVALKHGHDEIVRLLFCCYKQYRRTIFDDDDDVDSNAGSKKKSVIESDHWYSFKTDFSSMKI